MRGCLGLVWTITGLGFLAFALWALSVYQGPMDLMVVCAAGLMGIMSLLGATVCGLPGVKVE